MQGILKRLRIIKYCLVDSNNTIINLQIKSINNYLIDSELKAIIICITNTKIENIIDRIDSYIFKNKNSKIVFKYIKKIYIETEQSLYSKKLKTIELLTFEKLRRFCSNWNDPDQFHLDFTKNAKKHKALIYSALDKFLYRLENKNIHIVDWGCKQGIASTLVLDYIREKQLDIKVTDVLLIEEEQKVLSRAMLHVDVIKNEALHVECICKSLKDVTFSDFSFDNKDITLFLGINSDKETYYELLNENLKTSICYVLIGEEYDEKVDNIYEFLKKRFEIELISKQDGKIGRYKRYENIFMLKG